MSVSFLSSGVCFYYTTSILLLDTNGFSHTPDPHHCDDEEGEEGNCYPHLLASAQRAVKGVNQRCLFFHGVGLGLVSTLLGSR